MSSPIRLLSATDVGPALKFRATGLLMSFGIVIAVLAGPPVQDVQAQVVERRVSAEGTGPTRGHAIHDALVNASSQAFGLRLQASTTTSLSSAEINIDTATNSVLIDAFNKRISREVRTPGDRPILGYSVDGAERGTGGLWTARITLRHSDYEKLGAPADRRSVAVFVKAHPQAPALLKAIEPALIATRRFDVLSRDATQAFDREARFLRSGDAAPGEMARLGQGLGADYIVVTEFDNVRVVNNQQERIALSGEVYVRSQIAGAIRLEVIEMASRKKKWTGREPLTAVFEGAQKVDADMFSQRLEDAATALVARMTSVIYPIEIVRSEGGRLFINRGEGAVQPGERLEVLALGAELRDPQSGESLGEAETPVAMAEVIEVSSKFAVARLIAGQLKQGSRHVLRTPPTVMAPSQPSSQAPVNAPPANDNRNFLQR